ncbi:MAG TPA: CsbD family protein [Chthonomonadaceae bacterium]|nr:CsbD family protein [Chthonomonadaceae bacterium]
MEDDKTNNSDGETRSAQALFVGKKQRLEGKLKQAAGLTEEAFGRLTGKPKMQAAGLRKQAEGQIEEESGELIEEQAKKALDEA